MDYGYNTKSGDVKTLRKFCSYKLFKIKQELQYKKNFM
jgi:hypothetical protein